MKPIIIYPVNPLSVKVDTHYENELKIATQLGFTCLVFNFDEWQKNFNLFKLNNKPDNIHNAIYRGWMLTINEYQNLYVNCLKNNLLLITDAHQYRTAHYFPYIYPFIKHFTPNIDHIREATFINKPIEEQKTLFKGLVVCHPRFIIKDFVKSDKTQDGIKIYDRGISKDALFDIVHQFIKNRKIYQNFYEGIVFKTYVPLKKYNGITNEWRLWILNRKIIDYSQNSNINPANCKNPNLKPYHTLVTKISIPFYTLDIAEKTNSTWIILEAGDAQVSGSGTAQNLHTFYNNLILE